ncbi:class I SAM-dependent methyltransferase, partial [Streptomyces sp. CRN 30]|uniref:class I SAM-dependent methyltransferase n=1 Tax=Streptomyces sp. CRN 30 TaxID=3075613 RepID=UPI002A825CB0
DAPDRRHRAAARAVPPAAEPESWLDIGTGDGAFPAAAAQVHPYTCFDGLDPTPRVLGARAAGRVEEAHQGSPADPEIVARLRGRYDVISMLHHLEHSTDPRAELRAVPALLRPGGHLLIELWAPGRAFDVLSARRWAPGDRPGPLHLLPPRNVLAELAAAGCVAVAADRPAPYLTGALPATLDRALTPLLRRSRLSLAYRVLVRRPGSAP